jgi:pyridoxal phosphate enzyme (YggS family)
MSDARTTAIRERYLRVQAQIALAAQSAGRASNSVRLVVVTKTHPLEVVRATISAGVKILGENYAEEAVEKILSIGEAGVEWHMIGHVQSRKANLVAQHFDMLHSLDSLKLAVRLDRFAAEAGRKLPILLECNVSGEESKFGFPAWDAAQQPSFKNVVEQILQLPNIEPRGLMTMPPLSDSAEASRPYFVRLRRLRDELEKAFPRTAWTELSMGTSVDYAVAVAENATLVRVGTAILGPRAA